MIEKGITTQNNRRETIVTRAQRLAPAMAFVAIIDRYQPEKEQSDSWEDDAQCKRSLADADAFFPERGGSVRDAKKICGQCDVRVQCLEYALNNGEKFGVWGGKTEAERRRLRREIVSSNTGADHE